MKKLTIDPFWGMAGDMFSAALIDAGVPGDVLIPLLEEGASFLGGATVKVHSIKRQETPGTLLEINLISPPHSRDADFIAGKLEECLKRFKIKKEWAAFGRRALKLLIQAELEAHKAMGDPSGHCHLHEAQDILIDILGAARGLEWLGIRPEDVVCLSPVHTGSGTIHFSHGTHNIPAPATAALLEGSSIPHASGDIQEELLTPTGAAILGGLEPVFVSRVTYTPSGTSGRGFGHKEFSGEANALVVYLEEI